MIHEGLLWTASNGAIREKPRFSPETPRKRVIEWWAVCLIPKIGELQGLRKIFSADRSNHRLEIVAAPTVDTNLLILNLRGHFEFALTNQARDLFGQSWFDALFDFDHLTGMPQRRDVRRTHLNTFETDVPFGELAHDDFAQSLDLELVFC